MKQSLMNYDLHPADTIAHFDARQSNITWHPVDGVRMVDWSWVSAGMPKSDTTMFLIDLHKSGIDISNYLGKYFDEYQALLLMGYWVARSIEPSPTPDSTVRLHQLASAVCAADLLRML